MARVDHKKIKQLIAQKKKTITDRQFFTSRALQVHFEEIAAAQTRRYGYRRRVKVRTEWKPKEPGIANTNNAVIWINAGHKNITRFKTRQERYEYICGLFAHELGHLLYTDFLASQTYHSFQAAARWYPDKPPLRNAYEQTAEADYLGRLRDSPIQRNLLLQTAHEIMNVLEDGYVDNRMISEYPGILGASLQICSAHDYEDQPTLEQMVERETDDGHTWLTILQIILCYMRWGQIKYGATPLSDERLQLVFSMLTELDKALASPDIRDRCRAANLIIIRCWPHVMNFIEMCEEQAQESATSGGGSTSASEVMTQLLSSLAGTSAESTGDTAPVAGSASAAPNAPSPTARQRAATAKLAQESRTEDEAAEEAPAGVSETESSAAGGAGQDAGDDKDEDASPGYMAGQPLEGDIMPGDCGAPSGAVQQVSEHETGRIPLADTQELSMPEGGSLEQDNAYEGAGYAGAASDIQRVLEKMAENTVFEEQERQRTKELTELAQSISYGNIHAGVNMKVHRIASVSEDMKEQYNDICSDLLHISRQLQKSVLQQLKDSRRGGKQTALLMGRRLDSHALFRKDGRVFCKNALPNETPALSVGLLLDESGSMCSCDRATYARATAIILYDFCQALNIPIMVYGHSTGSGVDLYSYAEFDAIDRDDRYRMMDISARGSNRDGAALRYVAEQLSRRGEDVKLLMLVSDGQPADTGYYGTAAEEDLRGIKQEYQRKGVLFVAAAIGSDKENIERIYGDSYLDITDLNKLPVKLAGIIKRFIRV